MSKPVGTADKKDISASKPGATPGGPEQQHAPKKAMEPVGKSRRAEPAPGACHSWGCKASAKLFSFCDEHYEHFKFGLIKKTGEPVSDYEKKHEHYLAMIAKRGSV